VNDFRSLSKSTITMNSSSSIASKDVKSSTGPQPGPKNDLTGSVILDYLTKQLCPPKLVKPSATEVADTKDDVKSVSDGIPSTDTTALANSIVKLLTTAPQSKAMSTAIQSLPRGLKTKLPPMEVIVPQGFNAVNGGANTLNLALPVTLSSAPEWSSFAGLYDEYRYAGAEVKIMLNLTANASVSSDCMLGICYDPADNTPLSSTVNAAQFTRHKIFATSATSTGSAAVMPSGKPLDFKYSVKGDEVLSLGSGGIVSSAPGTWRYATNAGLVNDGAIKFYWSNSGASGAIALVGIVYHRVQLRSRR